MRVARVLTRLNLGGPARQALGADPELARLGAQVRVFAGTPDAGEGDLFEEFARRGIDVVRVPGLGRGVTGVGDLRAYLRLKRELAAFAPDVLHTHASKAGALGRRAAPAGVKKVHSFHGHVLEGYFGAWTSRRLVGLERRLAARTDALIAVAHATAADLQRLEVPGETPLVVVPPGVDLDPLLDVDGRSGALRGLIGASENDFVVGVLGRLAEVKCPERAVDVFVMLSQRHSRLQLVFVGDGSERRALERRVRALPPPLQERVHLVGARADIPEVLADLDGVLLTSRSEGAPVALIEAGAAGKPCVAMNVGGVGELIMNERTGFLGEDTDELAYGLDQLVSDPALADAVGRRARVRVREKYSGPALARRLHAVYEAVLGAKT